MKTVHIHAVLGVFPPSLQNTHIPTDSLTCANNKGAADAGARPLQPLHRKLSLVHLAGGHTAPSKD